MEKTKTSLLVIMTVFLLSIIINIFGYVFVIIENFLQKPDISQKPEVITVDYDYIVPGEKTMAEPKGKVTVSKDEKQNVFTKITDMANSSKNYLEGKTKNILLHNQFIEINGATQRLMGKKIVIDADSETNALKLNNGMLINSGLGLAQNNNGSENKNDYKNELDKLKKLLQEKNIPLYVFMAANKLVVFDSQLPKGFHVTMSDSTDSYAAYLKEENIDYLDFRDAFNNKNFDYTSMFFKTDHHWTPETGVLVAGIIQKTLSEKLGFSFNSSYFELDNYTKKIYKSWFLGSTGKRVGVSYAGIDDFSVLTPKFDTSFQTETTNVYNKTIVKKGTFNEALCYPENLENDKYNLNPYVYYSGGDWPIQIIKNKNAKNDKKIIMFRDSYASVVTPFLANEYSEIITLDTRNCTINLRRMLDQIRPDVLIILSSASIKSGFGAE